MRSPQPAHSRNSSVITHRAASRCLQRIASTVRRAGRSPSGEVHPLSVDDYGSGCQRANEDARRAFPSGLLPRATPGFPAVDLRPGELATLRVRGSVLEGTLGTCADLDGEPSVAGVVWVVSTVAASMLDPDVADAYAGPASIRGVSDAT